MEYEDAHFGACATGHPDKSIGMVIAHVDIGGQETMKITGIKKFGGALLGLLLFCGITLISSTTAQAQYPWNQDQYQRQQRERERQAQIERQRQAQRQSGWYDQYGNYHANNNQNVYNQNGYNRRGRNGDGYGNQGGSYELRQTALNAGYNEGLKAGREDRRRGRYNPTRYSNTLKDYNSRMGDRNTYQQYFVQAFQNGYADGYRGV